MRTFTAAELKTILEKHKLWLQRDPEGVRANLSWADLSEANLSEANLSRANLSWANLSEANLSRANLSWANLSEANLSWANLSEANLSGLRSMIRAVGNLKEIKSLQCDHWPVTYTATHMQIGCQQHTLEEWWSFSSEQISRMDPSALSWWNTWGPILKTIITASPAVPSN